MRGFEYLEEIVKFNKLLTMFILFIASSAYAISPPSSLNADDVQNNSARLHWNNIGDAAKYNVYVDNQYKTTTSSNEFRVDSLSSGSHSYYVVSIDYSGNYSSKSAVKAFSTNGSSSSSSSPVQNQSSQNSSSFQTPNYLNANAEGSNSARLDWQNVNAEKYNVYVNNSYRTTVSGNNSTTVNGLGSGRQSFYVVAISYSGQYSSKSVEKTIDIGSGSSNSSNNNSNSNNSLVDDQTPRNLKSGYRLAFSDEFNGWNINRSRWNTAYQWGPDTITNGEKQYYVDLNGDHPHGQDHDALGYNPFKFNGSTLAIQAAKTPDNKKWMAMNQPYLSGLLTSRDKFHTKFGYYEARIRIPKHRGTFPAFWLLHQNLQNQGTKRLEIDIMESLGHNTRAIYHTAHYYNDVSQYYGGNHVQLKTNNVYNGGYDGIDFGDDYHVYAVSWESGVIIYYIDGVEYNRIYDGNTNSEELYVLLNLAMGGTWTNTAAWGGLGYDFPSQDDLNNHGNPRLEIDYVRVYKRQ